ncbi:MAG: PKD domain-containing protein [Phycisphaerae bacterium]
MSKGLFLTILAIGVIGVSPVHGQNWWNPHWSLRRTVIVQPEKNASEEKSNRAGREGCTVTFLSGGECKPDGSDIRVTGLDGRPVKFFILSMGPGDLVRMVFDVKGITRQRYFIYYGNPKAKAEKNNWRPQGGLLLETWKYAGGPLGTPEAIKSTIQTAQSSPPIGRAYIPSMFIGGNIFGPDEPTCNLYTGYLHCRQGGTYTFTISSFDGSALYIDDKLVVEWPGRHGWVGDVRHQGKIDLKAGLHKLAFYHVNLSSHGGAVAAWSPPGSSTFRILEAGHFVPISRGQLGPLEKKHNELVADFTLRQTGCASMENKSVVTPLYGYSFTAEEPLKSKDTEYRWDFGDGQTANGARVEHVFFKEGLASITLKVKKGTLTDNITNRIYIGPNRLNPKADPDRLIHFESVISNYQFSRISTADAITIMDYFLIIDQPDKAIQVGRSVITSGRDAQKEPLVICAQKVAALMVEREGNYTQAADVLYKATKRLDAWTPSYRQLAAQTASMYINTLGEEKKTEELLKSCVGQSTQPADTMDKFLSIAWGDLYRFLGNRESAEKFYRQAEAGTDKSGEFSHSGGYVTAVEDYLRRGEYTEARKLLDRWQWECPTERLGGYSCLLRYRLLVAQKHLTQAKLLVKIIQGIDPFGFYARQMQKESVAASNR